MENHIQEDRRFAELMRLAQGGDGISYGQLLQQITPRLRRSVWRQKAFLQPQDVDDLVQSILLAVHSVRMTYDPRRPFLPWLTAIARNQIADSARRYARRVANEIGVEHVPETFPDDRANTNRESYGDPDALKAAIEALPTGQRRAIKMLKLEEMTLKETAIATGLSIAALKVAAHRAVRTLRKLLAGKA